MSETETSNQPSPTAVGALERGRVPDPEAALTDLIEQIDRGSAPS